MLANHTYVGQNNKQNTVFPFEFMYLTQGEGGSYSHAGTYAMDFQGMSSPSTRMLRCPYYAPVDLRLVAIADSANHSYVYTSLDKVNFVDGTYDYFTILVAHDDTSYSVGRIVAQGFELGKTGTYGIATGDHVHMEVKRGTYEGLIQNLQGNYMLKNSTHLYDLFGVNDTVLLVDGGYNWQEFSDSPFPYSSRRTSFPWVLYARKLRQK
jgi:hypothetical protein